MKALSIQQPWVYAILQKGKDIENRKWTTKHRGWIALHASAKPRRIEADNFPGLTQCPDLGSLDYSTICGVAWLSEVVTTSRSKWFMRCDDGITNYGWVLERVTPCWNRSPAKAH